MARIILKCKPMIYVVHLDQCNFLMLCIYSMQYVKHISTKSSLYLMRYIMLV